jgi:hypothetical protein
MATRALSPAKIMQLGVGFWGSKALLSAIELGLFTVLARGPRDTETLRLQLGLHPRSARDFFDALVALGMLRRTGTRYANTPETALFLDRNKSSYVGGILEMANARLYRFWGSLTDGLRTGNAQNEAKTGEDFFGTLYADPQRLEGFLKAMTGLSLGSARVIAKKFPWKRYRTFVDVGAHRAAWRWNSLWRTNTSPAGAWISQWCNRCSRPMPRRAALTRACGSCRAIFSRNPCRMRT